MAFIWSDKENGSVLPIVYTSRSHLVEDISWILGIYEVSKLGWAPIIFRDICVFKNIMQVVYSIFVL